MILKSITNEVPVLKWCNKVNNEKFKKMKTEKEIRDRLAMALKDFKYLEEEYDRAYKDKDILDICDNMTYVEAEIKTLRWILGE